ncbi:hypothetical protein BaRGS_00006938, partial [Batillaria attramentaria]
SNLSRECGQRKHVFAVSLSLKQDRQSYFPYWRYPPANTEKRKDDKRSYAEMLQAKSKVRYGEKILDIDGNAGSVPTIAIMWSSNPNNLPRDD